MKILYYDCFAGISGDMNLGAMIDLGVEKEYLLNELSKLKLEAEYEIKFERKSKNGISGTKVDVLLMNEEHSHKHDQSEDGHSHNHHNEHHHHDHHHHHHGHHHEGEHTHEHDHEHGVHRNLKDIELIINSSELNENVKRLSIEMFTAVGKAEAKVHGKELYEVHFHEVGAVDSIVDIVGAAICIDYLKPSKIIASPIEVGGGFVKCAHGLIPVPAPATVEILKGIPIRAGRVPFETTTPTGAAILAANVEEFVDRMEFTIDKIGYGLGTRDMEIPNVLRVYLASDSKSK